MKTIQLNLDVTPVVRYDFFSSSTKATADDLIDTFEKFSPVVLAYLGVQSSNEVSVIYGNGEGDEELYDQTLYGHVVYASHARDVVTDTLAIGWVGFGMMDGTIRVVATQNASPIGFFIRTIDVMKLPTTGVRVDD